MELELLDIFSFPKRQYKLMLIPNLLETIAISSQCIIGTGKITSHLSFPLHHLPLVPVFSLLLCQTDFVLTPCFYFFL